MTKKRELPHGHSIEEILKENEKIIKYATMFCIVFSIIYFALLIVWVYCKVKGI